jgi:putative RNA 2'-phosphotransferase
VAARRSTAASKFLSLVLRHDPARVGLAPDAGGWVDADALLDALARAGRPLSRAELDALVEGPAKRRFVYDAERRRVRASHGHSIAVSLDYAPRPPPDVLYHGTVARALSAIAAEGLTRRSRRYVHLGETAAVAADVARRHGPPVVLPVAASAMARDGHLFYRAPNGTWLVDGVPPRYLTLPSERGGDPAPPATGGGGPRGP